MVHIVIVLQNIITVLYFFRKHLTQTVFHLWGGPGGGGELPPRNTSASRPNFSVIMNLKNHHIKYTVYHVVNTSTAVVSMN